MTAYYATIPVSTLKYQPCDPLRNRIATQTVKSETLDIMNLGLCCQGQALLNQRLLCKISIFGKWLAFTLYKKNEQYYNDESRILLIKL